jgi:hypothetical protein
MPSGLDPGVYDPELVKIMGDALEAAWRKYDPRPRTVDLARQLLAVSIIEAADRGERTPETLAAAAIRALETAMDSRILRVALGIPSMAAKVSAQLIAPTRLNEVNRE